MKENKYQTKNISGISKVIIKCGTLLCIILNLLAFFSHKYGIDMCKTAVYMFAEIIISALMIDVILKRGR